LIALPFGIDDGLERYFLANGTEQAKVENIDFNLFTRRLRVQELIVQRGKEEVLNVSEAAPPVEKSESDGQGAASKDARFPLSDEAMLTLAKKRAERIEEVLVSRHGIDDKRIFIGRPEIDKSPEATPRVELVF
jgi:hypothetical protein